jgi:chemotaxis protein CheX
MTPNSDLKMETQAPSDSLLRVVEELTREAVRTVFKDMLNLEMADDRAEPLAAEEAGQIVSSVGFVGEATGVIHLAANLRFARVIASRMLGMEESELEGEETINDAFAELGNMTVGGVKSQLSDRGWPCTLTIPSILRGQQLRVQDVPDATRVLLGFRHGEQRLLAEIFVRKPAA